MTQYMLSVAMIDGEPMPLPEADMQRAFQQVNRLNVELQSAGAWVFAGGLLPATAATVVRSRRRRGPGDRRPVHRIEGAHRRVLGH